MKFTDNQKEQMAIDLEHAIAHGIRSVTVAGHRFTYNNVSDQLFALNQLQAELEASGYYAAKRSTIGLMRQIFARNADRINASFEWLGIWVAIYNCYVLIQDAGKVSGVAIESIVFFTLWGIWNLFYYPHLEQRASFYAALGLVLSNGTWLILLVLYRTGVL